MARLGDIVEKIRSKNAGPFWITIDIFCGQSHAYEIAQNIKVETVAAIYGVKACSIKRFTIDDLQVVKFSYPRPVVQGSRFDRDMHGAQAAHLLHDLTMPDTQAP